MRDQAQDLRELAARKNMVVQPVAAESFRLPLNSAERETRVIAVTSGKGGVGKTSFSLNLAVVMASENKRVLVIDGDMGLANVGIMAGLVVKKNIAHYIAGQAVLQEIIIPGPGGIDILPGASGIQELADLPEQVQSSIMNELNILAMEYDVVIIDTGAGINKNNLAFASIADDIIVVTLPEDIAITDAYSSIKTFSKKDFKADIHLVVNRVDNPAEAHSVIERITLVTSNFLSLKMKTTGFVYEDTHMRWYSMAQKIISMERPHSRSVVCIRDFNSNLSHGKKVKRGKISRIFNDMLNIFKL
jgi:flagellar biosynthesis protein FlhG